jgi:hypothetical protein
MRPRAICNRAFELVHAVMALAASKEHARAWQLAKRLEADAMLRARSGKEELALARPLAAAIMSFCRGDYDAAVESISAIRAAADRAAAALRSDLIHLTLLEAALRVTGSHLPEPWLRSVRTQACERPHRWLKARA